MSRIPVFSRGVRGSRRGAFTPSYGPGYGYPPPLAAHASPQIQEPTPAVIGPTGMPQLPAAVYDSPSTPGIATAGPLRGKRVGSSPNFYESVRKNNAKAGAQRIYGSEMQAARAPVPGAPPQAMQPAPGLGQSNTIPAASYAKSPDKARARIVTGAPPMPAAPNMLSRRQHVENEMERMRVGEGQIARGLGGDNRGFGGNPAMRQIAPMAPGAPATPDTRETFVRDFDRPMVPALNPQQQQAQAQARQRYQSTLADIDAGGQFSDQARQDAMVGAQADTAQAAVVGAQAKLAGANRPAGNAAQPRDTTLDNYSKNYQASVGAMDAAASEYWKGKIEEYQKGRLAPTPGVPAGPPAPGPASAVDATPGGASTGTGPNGEKWRYNPQTGQWEQVQAEASAADRAATAG